MSLALTLGLGAAIMASSFLMSDSARADERTPAGSSGALPMDRDDGDEDPGALCSAGSERSRTRRQYAFVSVSPRNPEFCVRRKLGGEAPIDLPDCWAMARDLDLGCSQIIDL